MAFTKVFLANGWRVYAACRKAEEFPTDVKSPNLTLLQLDVTDLDSTKNVAVALKNTPLDVLLNNAGRFDSTSVDDNSVPTNPQELAHVFQTNTVAPRLIAEALLPNLKAGSDKLVLTISSTMGTYAKLDDYHAEHWAYGASKAAVNYVMPAFGLLYPDIKSVLVSPGWVKTRMGGTSASLEPDFVAQKVYELVISGNVQSRTFVDYEGKPMQS